ncbi:hypothetical protein JCM10207_007979 [Rhodosporidiobolus poonsookiae]
MSFAKSASAEPVQDITVPSFTRLSAKPDPHVAFTILVRLPTRSYQIQQRYSAFSDLHQTLTATCGAPPPVELPSKHPFSRLNVFASRELTDDQLQERQQGLEAWLRAILAARDPRWRSSRAFKEFLAAPPDDGGAGALSSTGSKPAPRNWTASNWMAERSSVNQALVDLQSQVHERDSLLLSNSASAHAVAKEAKTALVDVVRRIGELTTGLDTLAKGGMAEGELNRRSGFVQRLQAEAEQLGKQVANPPRVGSIRSAWDDAAEPPSAARQSLLGSRAPARVLGAPAAGGQAQETAETRPLDNGGIMQLQQQYMDDQDSKLESLTAALRRQRHLGEMINQELALQEDVLDQLDAGTTRVQGKIKDAQKQMKKL